MSCSHSRNCQLYPQFAADPSLKLWQQYYCEGNFQACARFQIALKGEIIPLTLLPNGQLLKRYKSKDELGAHALFNAILKNRPHMVRSFLANKVSTGVITMADGTTPLMVAAERGHVEIVKLLLEAGCSATHRNEKGETAMDIAIAKGHQECADLIQPYLQLHSRERQHPQEAQGSIMSDVLAFLRRLNPLK